MNSSPLRAIIRFVRPAQPIPESLRSAFLHLFMDMAWMGVVSGTTVTFLSIYAARLGASSAQIGFISAAPALINLAFAIPAAGWTKGRSLGASAFWAAALARIFYLPFCFLPLLIRPLDEVWAIILITLVMNLPLTLLNVSFNAMFIEAVPFEWRAFVVGGRNGLLSITTVVFTLISGQILDRASFPLGYQIVFGMGFFGAAMSTLHLFFLRGHGAVQAGATIRTTRGLPHIARNPETNHYLRVLLLLFFFHTTQYLAIPLVPLYSVDALGLNDVQISLGNSLFNLIVFLGSFALTPITRRFGNHRVTGAFATGMAIFPILLALSRGFPLYMVTQLIGGVIWAILGGSLFNYLAENMPPRDRAASVSWYIFASNGAILIGSLLGPFLSNVVGMNAALIAFGCLRVLTGLAILRWG